MYNYNMCEECGETLSGHPPKCSLTPSKDVQGLVYAFERAFRENLSWYEYNAARQAILDAFSTRDARIAELEEENVTAAGASWLTLRAELASLRERALSPEERADVVAAFDHVELPQDEEDSSYLNAKFMKRLNAIRSKLTPTKEDK